MICLELLDTIDLPEIPISERIGSTKSEKLETKDNSHKVSMDQIVDFEALFIKASVTKLHDCQLDAPSTALWRTGWQKSLGYR